MLSKKNSLILTQIVKSKLNWQKYILYKIIVWGDMWMKPENKNALHAEMRGNAPIFLSRKMRP